MNVEANPFVKYHSAAIVCCLTLAAVLIFVKYLPLYRSYHGRQTELNNASSPSSGNDTFRASPLIKSPVACLVINFVCTYTVIVLFVCLYGLYKRPETAYGKIPGERSKSDSRSDEPNDDNNYSDDDDDDDESVFSCRYLSEVETLESNAVGCACGPWTGDWNEYWNDKNDY